MALQGVKAESRRARLMLHSLGNWGRLDPIFLNRALIPNVPSDVIHRRSGTGRKRADRQGAYFLPVSVRRCNRLELGASITLLRANPNIQGQKFFYVFKEENSALLIRARQDQRS